MFQRWVLTLVVVLAWTVVATADDGKVGGVGEIDRIEFAGNQHFTAEQIREGLVQNLDIVIAGRPDGAIDLWLRTLEHQVACGYQTKGYAKVQTKARHDTARGIVGVEIIEGSQYHCGAIKIIGATTLPVDRFREQLAVWRVERSAAKPDDPPVSPHLPANPAEHTEPLWIQGDTAECSAEYWRSRTRSLRSIFQSLGYFSAEFTVSARAESDRTATLVVTIDNEGSRATIDRYEIVGNLENSAEDVIRYLGLPLGTPLDLETVTRLQKKLWDSARFLKHHVEVIPVMDGNAMTTTVKIVLEECDEAPPLSMELTAEQTAWLQFVRWIETMNSWKEDVDIEVALPLDGEEHDPEQELPPGTRIISSRFVLSPTEKGLFVSAQIRETPDHLIWDAAVQMTPEKFAMDALTERLRYDCRGLHAHVLAEITWKAIRDKNGNTSRLMMGARYRTFKDVSVAPFTIFASLPPALALRAFREYAIAITFSDGLAKMEVEGVQFSFDRTTGALNELSLDIDAHQKVRVSCRAGVYRTLVAEHERAMEGAQRVTPGDVPITSFVRFAIRCLPNSRLAENASREPLARFGLRLLKHDVFRSLDDLVKIPFSKRPFFVPHENSTELVRPHVSWAFWELPICRSVLPNSDWARIVGREYVLADSMRNYRPTESFIKFLSDGKVGPITVLATSFAFGFSNPLVHHATAKIGLTKMTDAGVQADWDLFVNGDWPVGKMLLAMTAAIQDADTAEIEALAGLISIAGVDRDVINVELKTLAADKKSTPQKALRNALERNWETLIQPAVETMLKLNSK